MSAIWVSFFARQGRDRDQLEDALVVGGLVLSRPTPAPLMIELDTSTAGIVAVLDGVGGNRAGHIASRSAGADLAEVMTDVEQTDGVAPAIVEVSRRLVDDAAGFADREGMATTVAGMAFRHQDVDVFNVGDSRIFVLYDEYLTQCSFDDVVDPTRRGSPLSQWLGAERRHLEPHVTPMSWSEDGIELLCTDGLYGGASIEDLEATLREPNPIEALWEIAGSATDDASVVLVDGRAALRAAQWQRDRQRTRNELGQELEDARREAARLREILDTRPPPPASAQGGGKRRGLPRQKEGRR